MYATSARWAAAYCALAVRRFVVKRSSVPLVPGRFGSTTPSDIGPVEVGGSGFSKKGIAEFRMGHFFVYVTGEVLFRVRL